MVKKKKKKEMKEYSQVVHLELAHGIPLSYQYFKRMS